MAKGHKLDELTLNEILDLSARSQKPLSEGSLRDVAKAAQSDPDLVVRRHEDKRDRFKSDQAPMPGSFGDIDF